MKIDFDKGAGLVPVVVQDADSLAVLMLAYMNAEAFEKTQAEQVVTFYSRSKERLWTKGETSGNMLDVVRISVDCDADTILIQARPRGPVCHTGEVTCFGEPVGGAVSFLGELAALVSERKQSMPTGSYTTELFTAGIAKIAQKVGEEAVETVIEAVEGNADRLCEESADLLFHLLVLLEASNVSLFEVVAVLKDRHSTNTALRSA